MRFAALALIPLAACTGEASHLGNPLWLPVSGISTAAENAIYNERRGRVEIWVKTNHQSLLAEIKSGGGSALTQAMDIAGVPVPDRPARIVQMQGDLALYSGSPDALVVALMVYAG